MAKGRKTVSVVKLLDDANFNLARTDKFATQEFKAGIAMMLHSVLHESGNYEGFSYIEPFEHGEEWKAKHEWSRYYSKSWKLR